MHHLPKAFLLLFILLLACTHSEAQLFTKKKQSTSAIDNEYLSQDVLFRKEMSFGGMIHSQGWGLFFSRGKNKTAFTRQVVELELATMKNSKEIRTLNPYFANSKSYIFGKLNHVYLLRATLGENRLLNRKPYWGGVELRYFYHGGISLGFTKPIYLYIINYLPLNNLFFEYNLTTEKYDPERHYLDNIYGRAPFNNGLNEIGFHPGILLKSGISFEYGTLNQRIKGLELGLVGEYFPGGIQIMALNDKTNLFFTFYLKIRFGKRYN